ncbi:10607_t:CDS:2 [Paraglomus occultum]|uniref:10607_t:CDS:1 n=1 Tax=Paraglomus occultum TaxID=144539 RepID=A0A9N9C020_9GLOM|nr:10607_t:CDS:2 [Paraglomus occultum]
MESLVNDIEELKQQAIPPLTDTSAPLDVENVQLACENQKLISENSSLTETAEEYEATIRLVVSKFRTQVIKIQQAKKQLNCSLRKDDRGVNKLRIQALQYENNNIRSRLAETAKRECDNVMVRTLEKGHESLKGVEDVVEERERDVPRQVVTWEGGVKVDGEFLEKDGLK